MHPKFKEALELHKNGKLIEANNILLEILKETPNDFESLHLLGIIAFQSNRLEASVDLIKKATDINNILCIDSPFTQYFTYIFRNLKGI